MNKNQDTDTICPSCEGMGCEKTPKFYGDSYYDEYDYNNVCSACHGTGKKTGDNNRITGDNNRIVDVDLVGTTIVAVVIIVLFLIFRCI